MAEKSKEQFYGPVLKHTCLHGLFSKMSKCILLCIIMLWFKIFLGFKIFWTSLIVMIMV